MATIVDDLSQRIQKLFEQNSDNSFFSPLEIKMSLNMSCSCHQKYEFSTNEFSEALEKLLVPQHDGFQLGITLKNVQAGWSSEPTVRFRIKQRAK